MSLSWFGTLFFVLRATHQDKEFRKEEVSVSVLDCAKNRINFEDPWEREPCLQQSKTGEV